MSAEFQLGDIVRLKSAPAVVGAVVSVVPGENENRFEVFANGEKGTYYASQLEAAETREDALQIVSRDEFNSRLTALQIRYPALSTLYSLNAARIDFIPYQFRPVLRFIRSDRPRLLIADGVGVGKTIEAGLIMRELQARSEIRSILIVCPRPLVAERKWEIEMKRFEEDFVGLDGGGLRHCIRETDLEGVWPERYRRVIVPYSLFDESLLHGSGREKRKHGRGLLDLDPPPRFDLVIVDEAHHIRNPATFRHKAVKFFCEHAEAVVFLTATPIQLGSRDLFVLLNTLRPDLVLDDKSFESMSAPNPFINRAVDAARAQSPGWPAAVLAALKQAAETSWGRSVLRHDPEFQRICEMLEKKGGTSPEERVRMIGDLESLHTFSGIINRTRRREIGDFTVRKPQTMRIGFTPSQKILHDELIRVQEEIFVKIHGNSNVSFMMTTLRRQAASCLFGLAPLIKDILSRRLDSLPLCEAEGPETVSAGAVDEFEPHIRSVLEKSRKLDPKDPKLDALRKILRDKQDLPNNRVILFSSFLHTLRYIYGHLRADGFRVGMIHGGTPDEDRVEIGKRLRMPKGEKESIDILLLSEVGCEGLDYQFCDCIVNYDLPWNPMRIEQRIGRIDRHGQKSESVAIFNLITPETVDADIYDRCLERIGVFNRALGSSEEILGDITKEIGSIAKNFSLSEAERREKLQQLADNKVRQIREENELEEKQLELFGIELPEDRIKREIEEASSFWLSPASIQMLVSLYLKKRCGKEQDYILGEKPLKTLRLSQDARNILLEDFKSLERQKTTAYRKWEEWLKEGDQHLPVTFESDCAKSNTSATFIMPLHPLVKQSADFFGAGKERFFTALKTRTNKAPAGAYEFAIYQWRYQGIKQDLTLKPVTLSDKITPLLVRLLEKAVDEGADGREALSSPVCKELDSKHYNLWKEARDEHRRRTQNLAAYRKESLSTSHRARMGLLRDKIANSGNEKIKRMHQSEMNNAEADYQRRVKEIEGAMSQADIITEPVAYGVLVIEREG